jgi:hypothetical protein
MAGPKQTQSKDIKIAKTCWVEFVAFEEFAKDNDLEALLLALYYYEWNQTARVQ